MRVVVLVLLAISCVPDQGEDHEAFRKDMCILSGGEYRQMDKDWECIEKK